jgi:signal transduction histidine kinase/ligand-binding sensor domain-containing protein
VLQDGTGYVWFATRDGLSRWNGYEFTNLTQSHGFTTPAIDRICQARTGEYWVVGNDGALYSYLPVRPHDRDGDGRMVFKRRSVEFGGKGVLFTHLYEDDDGMLWGGGHGVLVKDVGARNLVIPLAWPTQPPGTVVIVHAMARGRDGTLWIGTDSGLFGLDRNGRTFRYALTPTSGGDGVNALAVDAGGRLWVGHSSTGVIVLPAGSAPAPGTSLLLAPRRAVGTRIDLGRPGALLLTTANGLPDNAIVSLLAASDGQVWVGTGRGLARFDGTGFSRYTRDDGLCDNIIHSLAEDGDGNVWIATPTGAMRVALDGFSGYTLHEGLGSDHVVAIGEMPGGRVYAIGRDWSINVFDGARFHASRLPVPSDSSLMWASQAGYRDRDGRWWALTHQGLFRFPPPRGGGLAFSKPDRRYTTLDGLPSSRIFRMFQDRRGALWVGTRSGDPPDDGLARFDAALDRAAAFGERDGLPPRMAPSAFVEDRQGDLWVGFYQGGLARYRDGRFRLYSDRDGLPAGMVTALLLDRRGRLWIATNMGGIGRVDDPSTGPPAARIYSRRDGLSSDNVRALAEDHAGRIFAGTVRGVDRLDPDTGRFRHYGTGDGLVGDFVTSAFCDSNGDLWFGAYGGLSRLRQRRDDPPTPPPIAVTGLRVSGEPYPVLELGEPGLSGVVLDGDRRDVAIDFVSVSRHYVEGIRYQYSVDGGNRWSEPAAARTVTFARLPPGEYVFAVRALTPGREVSREPATVRFTIPPPLWQRGWFIALITGVAAAVLFALYRIRVRRLIEMERLRMRIASDLHDEIAANLSSIAALSAVVRAEAGQPSPFLERITTLATESVDATRDIIWSIDPRTETIGSLLVRLRDAMVAGCRARGLHLALSVPSDGMSRNLTPEQRKNLWLLLKEAVNNAARHSGATEIALTAAFAGRQVRITVRDNGRGFAPDGAAAGRGLATMRARAESLGGTLSITAAPGAGTSVEILVSLAN